MAESFDLLSFNICDTRCLADHVSKYTCYCSKAPSSFGGDRPTRSDTLVVDSTTMGSLPDDTHSSAGNIVHGSDTCTSLEEDYTRASQVNVQTSPAGHNLRIGKMYTIDSPSREILEEAIEEFGSQLKDIPLTAGGAGIDIARIAQWLLPKPKTVAFVGARASDEDAYTLKELCRHARVAIRMEEMVHRRTPVLLVAHYKRKWCEIFFIDNMATISTSFIDKPFVTTMLERANIVYITELGVLMNPKMTLKLAYYSFSRFKHCLLFLHREQFIKDIKDSIQEILSYVDIIFLTPKCCNRWRHAWDIYLWLKAVAKKSSIVIVSDGLKTAYVHTDLNTGTSAKYKSKFVRHAKAVDYYGIGCAFVAGFMAMLIRGHQLDPCVECGFFCSSVIVQKYGVHIPDDEAVLNEWHLLLDHILHRKIVDQSMGKRESNLPFTMFQTPWREGDVNQVFGTTGLRGEEVMDAIRNPVCRGLKHNGGGFFKKRIGTCRSESNGKLLNIKFAQESGTANKAGVDCYVQ